MDSEYFLKKKEYIPDTLYRYCKPKNYNIEALKSGCVWASHTRSFNDPFEGNYQIDDDGYIRRQLAKKMEKDGLIKENSTDHLSKLEYNKVLYTYNDYPPLHLDLFHLENQIFKSKSPQLQEKIKETTRIYQTNLKKIENKISKTIFFVVSLTEEPNNPPMWAHYADNYGGFLIEYDIGAMKERWGKTGAIDEQYFMNRLFPVKYLSTQQIISKSHLLNSLSISSQIAFEDKVVKSLLTKVIPWAYEKEWRILADPKSGIRGYSIPFPYARKVTCGYNMKRKYLDRLHQICMEKNIEFAVQYKSPWSKHATTGTYESFINDKEFFALQKKVKHQ